MSRTPAEVSASIIQTLQTTTGGGLSCELGTPERKIIDACAEAISAAYVDQYLIGGLLDIDTKVGLELEQWVGIFGFGRLQGRPARGVIHMSLTTPSTVDTQIPVGTQYFTRIGVTGSGSPLQFATTQPAVLLAGTYTIDIPVECTTSGTIGNVAPDSITGSGVLIGASSVTNLAAMTGGVDTETDAGLRQRFKETLLRNVSGTRDWYLAVCLQNNSVSRANVVGPVSLYRTQIEVQDTPLTLDVQDVKYVWRDGASVFVNLGQADEQFYIPGIDFNLTAGTTNAPIFTRGPSENLTIQKVVDLEFQYTTRSSRNDPDLNRTNKVDVFVDGIDPFPVTEQTIIGENGGADTVVLKSSPDTDPLYNLNFERIGSSGTPTAGNRFMRLGSVPVIAFPPKLTIGGTTYNQGEHYHLIRTTLKNVVNETTLLTGSQREICGVEWLSTGPSVSPSTPVALSFVYNRVPEILYTVISQSKQIATDVLVHQADYRYFEPCLSVEYDRSYARTVVDRAINDRLKKYFQGIGFGASIKLSNLCMAVQQVLGVVDVKITTEAEAIAHGQTDYYGIRLYDNGTDTVPDFTKTADFKLSDSQVPMYYGVKLLRRPTT